MLNGVVVLLSLKMNKIGQVRALGLLLTAFVALGLDSYLFGLVTGDSSCHRAWTEAMLAAGLLGIGAVAIIAGFGLLVAEYVSEGDSESLAMLRMLFNFLRGGVALVVLTLLFMTSWNYLYAVLSNNVPAYAKDFLWAYLGIGALAVAIIIVRAASAEQVRRELPQLLENCAILLMRITQRMPALLPEAWASKLMRAVQKIANRLAGSRVLKQQVNRAMYLSFGYAIVSVLGASLSARTSPQPWNQPGTLTTAAVIATVGWVLIFSLFPLFYLIVRCSPPFGGDGDRVGATSSRQHRPASARPGQQPEAVAEPATGGD